MVKAERYILKGINKKKRDDLFMFGAGLFMVFVLLVCLVAPGWSQAQAEQSKEPMILIEAYRYEALKADLEYFKAEHAEWMNLINAAGGGQMFPPTPKHKPMF